MIVAIVLGVIGALAGATLVVTGIRRGPDADPRNMVMLIGGMMLTAFGIVIAGFAIVYTSTAPLSPTTGVDQ
ncbi:MAG TPA: hypothetical protein VM711_03890 [Sphingomicrobium sp.]|nr:hypothetical protein [Sphingomicrobium sp.]